MKEQWSINENNIQLADMEGGLYQEKQKYVRKIEYKTNCCIRCIPYLRLIFLLEVMLFFGWSCYMLLQNYRPREIKNEAMSIALERYPSMVGSLPEIQKSRPGAEMPVIFVKPEVSIDKINNLLEDMKFTKDQHLTQKKAIVTNVLSTVQTNGQNSNNIQSNNVVGISAVNRLLATLSSGNLVHDRKFTKSPISRETFSVDKNVNTDKNEKIVRHEQFLEKLRNINKMKATNDLEKLASRNDFTEDVNRLMLESQENHMLDASSKLENLELNVAIISNSKQEFSDLTKDATQDGNNENSSLFDEPDKRINARLELDLIISPPYKSHELSDILIKDSVVGSSQPLLAEKISKQIENGSSNDIDKKNEDKHDINDSNMSASASGNQDHFDTSEVTVQNIEEEYSSESTAKIKEDEKYESMENINYPFKFFLQSTEQDSVESSTSNVDKFQWFNAPPSFVDFGLEDISKSSEIHSSLWGTLWDTYENMDVDDVIPGSQCEITIKMGILNVKCPAIKFDEEWNVTSSKVPVTDVPKVTNFGNIFDVYLHTECDEDANKKLEVEDIFNENSDKEATTSRDSALKRINAIDLQESTTSAKILNDAVLDLSDPASMLYGYNPFNEEISQDYYYDSNPFYDSNEEEIKQVTTVSSSISEFGSIDSNERRNPFLDISGIQQEEQLKISKEQDYSASDNVETFLKDFEHFHALEKTQISLFENEMLNIMTRYLKPKSFYENNYRNNICSIFRYMRSISQYPWSEQYIALKKLLEYIQNPDYPHNTDDSYYRKKRMTDDLTWQQDQISNTLEEDDKDADLLENLKKIFQKMEILALCIDRLHERYLLHNKLDDDYASSEFPIETQEHRELYTSRTVYEK